MRLRHGAAILALGALVLATGCGGDDGSAPKTGTGSTAGGPAVDAFDFGFKPANDVIDAGTTVRWTNTGKLIHTVKQLPDSKEKFFSKALDPGATYSHRFDKPGRYPYFCTLHPTRIKGTITVR
jgi:plastocyanin